MYWLMYALFFSFLLLGLLACLGAYQSIYGLQDVLVRLMVPLVTKKDFQLVISISYLDLSLNTSKPSAIAKGKM